MDRDQAAGLDIQTYTVKNVKFGTVIVYSKTSSDNLPITTTQLAESTPCYIPSEY